LIGLAILILISRPLKPWKLGLAAAMAGLYAFNMALPAAREYFELDLPPLRAWVAVAIAAAIGAGSASLATHLLDERSSEAG
jgi:hypothetical protein